MEDELSCTICKYKFGSTYNTNPRTLSCGHTYCTLCLQKLFRLDNTNCPECRLPIMYDNVSQIPVSITLLRIVDAHKAAAVAAASSRANLSSIEEQKLSECQSAIKQVNVNKKNILIGSDTVDKEINERLVDMGNEIHCYIQATNKTHQWQESLKKLYNKNVAAKKQNNANSSLKKEDLTHASHWLDDITQKTVSLALATSRTVWAMENTDKKDESRYAEVTRNGNHVLLHSLKKKQQINLRKEDIIVPYNNLRSLADRTTPSTFLELEWPHGKGTVKIDLENNNARAEQFALLCSGEEKATYTNSYLLRVSDKGRKGSTIWGGDYEHNNGTGGKTVIANCNRELSTSFQLRGIVTSTFSDLHKKSAQFGVCLNDHKPYKFVGTFGKVIEGLQVLDAASCYCKINEVLIKDSGLLIPIEVRSYL